MQGYEFYMKQFRLQDKMNHCYVQCNTPQEDNVSVFDDEGPEEEDGYMCSVLEPQQNKNIYEGKRNLN